MYITVKTAVKSKLYLKMQAIKVPCSFNRKVMNFRWGFTWVLMGPFPSLGTVGGGCPCCSTASSGCIQHSSTSQASEFEEGE